MAGRLIVELRQPISMGDESPGMVSAEVVRTSDGLTRSFPLDFDTPRPVEDLKPGQYSVRAFLPSGAVMSQAVELGESDARSVTLTVPDSPHEWLGWETVLGDTASRSEFTRTTSRPAVPSVWMCVWEPHGEWQPRPWPQPSNVESDLVTWKFYIPAPMTRPLAFQLGGPGVPWRTVILPPGNQSLVLIRPDSNPQGELRLSVGTANRRYDSLLRYLQDGDQASLRVLGEETADLAERMLFEKTRDPFGAVVGGYVLIVLGEFERMHSWTRHLSDWFEDIADGAIIHATRLLREGHSPASDEVRGQLLTAASRLAPVLSYGVELLHRGLRLLYRATEADGEVEAACKRAEALAAAVDWSKPFTTYGSLDPNRPDVAAPEGMPLDSTDVQWLPEGDGYVSTGLPLSAGKLEPGGWVRSVVQVRPAEKGGWEVRGLGSVDAFSVKTVAEAAARKLATSQPRATVVVQRKDGSTQRVSHTRGAKSGDRQFPVDDKEETKEECKIYGFKAFVFDGKKTARKALDGLEDRGTDYIWIDDVAEVSRSKHGSIRVHSNWAQDDDAVGGGIGWGALTGGLIGALAGPGGALAGAIGGGSVGGLVGTGINLSLDDPRLDDFASALSKDTSALILLGEEATLADFVSAFEPFGGKIIETTLDEKDIKALRKALKQT